MKAKDIIQILLQLDGDQEVYMATGRDDAYPAEIIVFDESGQLIPYLIHHPSAERRNYPDYLPSLNIESNGLTPLTENEIQVMCALYMNHGKADGVAQVTKFLQQKFGYSDVHAVITEIRKEFNKRLSDMWQAYHEADKPVNLTSKLGKRLTESDEREKQLKSPSNGI